MRSQSSKYTKLKLYDKVAETAQDKNNLFSEYFSSVYTKISTQSLPSTDIAASEVNYIISYCF